MDEEALARSGLLRQKQNDRTLQKRAKSGEWAVTAKSANCLTVGGVTHSMPCPCRAHTVPLRVKNVSFPFDLHSAAVSVSHLSCLAHAVLLKATAQHGRLSTAVLCCGVEKNGMVVAWHGHGTASVNDTRPHCVNQMGKTHSKRLAARHAMCESALYVLQWKERKIYCIIRNIYTSPT